VTFDRRLGLPAAGGGGRPRVQGVTSAGRERRGRLGARAMAPGSGGSGGDGGRLGARAAAVEVTAACRRFEMRQRREEKGAQTVYLSVRALWALPRIFVGYQRKYTTDSSVNRQIYVEEPHHPGARYVRSWRNRQMYIKVIG
jgi:hypothetical protein